MYDPFAEFEKTVLPNGLTVYSTYWDRPWVQVGIVVHSGAREDPASLPGLAHFVEHLVSENIPTVTKSDARRLFEKCGGGYGFGTTTYLATKYDFGVSKDDAIFAKALSIFGSMLIGAKIEKEIERERQVIMREFREKYPFAEKLAWEQASRRAIFHGHPLAEYNRPLGRPEGFMSASMADLQLFYDTHYTPHNISLVVVGGMSKTDLIEHIKSSPFGARKNGIRNAAGETLKQLSPPATQEQIICLGDYSNLKIARTEYVAVWPLPIQDQDYSIKIFNRMLQKILFREIREKLGLAYKVSVTTEYFGDICEYMIKCIVSSEATYTIDAAVQNGIELVSESREIFEHEKESEFKGYLMADLSGSEVIDISQSMLARVHQIQTASDILNKIEQIRFEHMQKIASLLACDRKFVSIYRP